MKFLFLFVILLFTTRSFAAPCKKNEQVFHINMPIILGKTIFNDQVDLCKGKNGLYGQLSVPKRFTANLENIKLTQKKLSFSITADEGKGTFQVHYAGELKGNNKFFLGIAKLDNQKTLGPFIGVISPGKKIDFKLIQ